MKKHLRTLSIEDLSAHQQRIRSIVNRVNNYSPTFHLNPSYNRSIILRKMKIQRQGYEERLFQQNMNIIEKLQSVGPKINSKRFPQVNLAARSKRKCKSVSLTTLKRSPPQKIYKPKDEIKVFEENMAIIEKLQSIDRKVSCWQDKTLMQSRIIRQKKQVEKRNELLQKFKEISKEIKALRPSNTTSRVRQQSPYLICQDQRRKKSEADHETNANSFILKKQRK